jgi:hypothetical protein
MLLVHATDPSLEALPPLIARLIEAAQAEEELLAAIRAAVERNDRDQVFELAKQLTHSCAATTQNVAQTQQQSA